jgi:hypothetical protein
MSYIELVLIIQTCRIVALNNQLFMTGIAQSEMQQLTWKNERDAELMLVNQLCRTGNDQSKRRRTGRDIEREERER